MDFSETDEQQMLREAVDGIASKYGHSYFAERARSGGTPTSCGTSWRRRGSWG